MHTSEGARLQTRVHEAHAATLCADAEQVCAHVQRERDGAVQEAAARDTEACHGPVLVHQVHVGGGRGQHAQQRQHVVGGCAGREQHRVQLAGVGQVGDEARVVARLQEARQHKDVWRERGHVSLPGMRAQLGAHHGQLPALAYQLAHHVEVHQVVVGRQPRQHQQEASHRLVEQVGERDLRGYVVEQLQLGRQRWQSTGVQTRIAFAHQLCEALDRLHLVVVLPEALLWQEARFSNVRCAACGCWWCC
mmetsp:Transcript_8521/g.21522  ORF Transcript_8521/g.21522 Transcript_8521/m.21522 type:complete len:249 (+) Transcript_8521:795-1541(+)